MDWFLWVSVMPLLASFPEDRRWEDEGSCFWECQCPTTGFPTGTCSFLARLRVPRARTKCRALETGSLSCEKAAFLFSLCKVECENCCFSVTCFVILIKSFSWSHLRYFPYLTVLCLRLPYSNFPLRRDKTNPAVPQSKLD